MAEYRLEEIAKASGVNVRNIRAYRERGLLDPPRREGRSAFYGDHHLRVVQAVVVPIGDNSLVAIGHSSGRAATLRVHITELPDESGQAQSRPTGPGVLANSGPNLRPELGQLLGEVASGVGVGAVRGCAAVVDHQRRRAVRPGLFPLPG